MEGARWSRSILKMAAVCFAVAVALCCVWYWACGGCTGGEGAAAVLRSDFQRKTSASCTHQAGCSSGGGQWHRRRRLSGRPGSYPPRCTSKCGECNPCYPVHVAVPPGVPVTTEYYPEAWRCKCGNRLYMP